MDIWWNKGPFNVRFANKSGSHHHGISWYRKNSITVKACRNKLFWVRKIWTDLSRYSQNYLGLTWGEIMKIPFLAIFIQTLNTIFLVSELNHVQTYKHMHQSDTSSSTSMASVPSGNTSTSVSPSRSIKYYTSQVSFRQFHNLELESNNLFWSYW